MKSIFVVMLRLGDYDNGIECRMIRAFADRDKAEAFSKEKAKETAWIVMALHNAHVHSDADIAAIQWESEQQRKEAEELFYEGPAYYSVYEVPFEE